MKAKINISILVLFVVGFTETHGAAVPSSHKPTCDELEDMILAVYNAYVKPSFEDASSFLSVNWADPNNVHDFACTLTAIKTIEDLASLIHMPYESVRHYYYMQIEGLQAMGGTVGLLHLRGIQQKLIPAAESAGIPNWPLKWTSEQLEHFLNQMVSEFGDDFLGDYMWPRFQDLIVIEDVPSLAHSLAHAGSQEDLASRLDVDLDLVQAIIQDLTHDLSLWPEVSKFIEPSTELVIAFQNLGLFDLIP